MLAGPLNSLEKKGETLKKTGNSLKETKRKEIQKGKKDKKILE